MKWMIKDNDITDTSTITWTIYLHSQEIMKVSLTHYENSDYFSQPIFNYMIRMKSYLEKMLFDKFFTCNNLVCEFEKCDVEIKLDEESNSILITLPDCVREEGAQAAIAAIKESCNPYFFIEEELEKVIFDEIGKRALSRNIEAKKTTIGKLNAFIN